VTPAENQAAITAARDVLPAWVVWGNDLIYVVGALLLTVPTTWLAARFAIRPLRAANPDSWVERARLAYPARRVLLVAGLLFPLFIVAWGFAGQSPFSRIPRPVIGLATGLLDAILIVGIRRRIEKEIGSEPVTLGGALRTIAALLAILIPHIVVALFVLGAMPEQFDRRAFVLLGITAAFAFLLCAGGNLFLGRILKLVEPASPRLREIVARAAARTGIGYARVYSVNWGSVNALAFPPAKSLAFTARATECLTDAELEEVAAHELGHLAESRAAQLVRLGIPVAIAVYVPAIHPLATTWGAAGLAVSFVVFLLLIIVFARFSRRQERRADEVAAAGNSGDGVYARALETIYRLNLTPAVLGSRLQCHPDLYDRLVASGVEPAYARPARPSRGRLLGALAHLLLPLMTGLGLFVFAGYFLITGGDRGERKQHLILALYVSETTDAWALHNLGWSRDQDGDHEQAIAFLKASVGLDPQAWQYPFNLCNLLSSLNRCDEARRQWLEASRRVAADPAATPGDRQLVEESFQAIADCIDRTHPKPAFAVSARLLAPQQER
jgi:Zn-dependent protease with chaperone function